MFYRGLITQPSRPLESIKLTLYELVTACNKRNKAKGDFNLTHSIILPGDRLYNTDIKIDPFTVQDVSKLVTIAESSKSSNDIFDLLDSKLNISIDTINENDLTYIMWWLRFNTFIGINKVVSYVCPVCFKTHEVEITSETISKNITKVPQEYTSEGLKVKLSEDREVPMKLITIGQIKAVNEYMTRVLDTTSEDTRTLLLNIQGIEPNVDLHTKYNKYVLDEKTKLTPSEYYNAMKFYQDYNYGINKYFDLFCSNPKCKSPLRLPLEVSLFDFFPSIYNN